MLSLEASQQLDAVTITLLQQFGFAGPGSVTTPRMPDLKVSLERLGVASPAAAASLGGATLADTGGLSGTSTNRWTASLPVDFKRAPLVTFRNMRSCGCVTVRDWITQSFQGSKSSEVWVDLWTIATSLDYRLSEAALGGDAEVVRLLNSDDTIELQFRRLASYVYTERTGDVAGGNRMLGQPAPGTRADVAPSWLVDEVTSHSKAEYQRSERVNTSRYRAEQRSMKGQDGNGKGGKAGKRPGKSA